MSTSARCWDEEILAWCEKDVSTFPKCAASFKHSQVAWREQAPHTKWQGISCLSLPSFSVWHPALRPSGHFSFCTTSLIQAADWTVGCVSAVVEICSCGVALHSGVCTSKEVKMIHCLSGPKPVSNVPLHAPLSRAAGPQEWARPTHLSSSPRSPFSLFVPLNSRPVVTSGHWTGVPPDLVWCEGSEGNASKPWPPVRPPPAGLHQTGLFAFCQNASISNASDLVRGACGAATAPALRMTKCSEGIVRTSDSCSAKLWWPSSVSHAVRQEWQKESDGFRLKRERKSETEPCWSLCECVSRAETAGPLVSLFAPNESVSSLHSSHCKYSPV